MGITDITSFLIRMPNLVRDMESGKLRQDQIPDHMRPAFDKYIAMRDRLGDRMGVGGAPQAQAPARPTGSSTRSSPAPAPQQAPRRDFSGMTVEQLQNMSPEDNYDYWTQKFESGELNEATYRMMISPYLKYKRK